MADSVNVLLVAENATLRAALGRAMRAKGMRVLDAADGVDALARLDVERFGIVVLSLGTPGFTSQHVIEYMRATSNAPDVLILREQPTGASLPGLARVEAYVPGPIETDELVGLAERMHAVATRAAQPPVSASGMYAKTAPPALAPGKRGAGRT